MCSSPYEKLTGDQPDIDFDMQSLRFMKRSITEHKESPSSLFLCALNLNGDQLVREILYEVCGNEKVLLRQQVFKM